MEAFFTGSRPRKGVSRRSKGGKSAQAELMRRVEDAEHQAATSAEFHGVEVEVLSRKLQEAELLAKQSLQKLLNERQDLDSDND